jgi:hypothetical protein
MEPCAVAEGLPCLVQKEFGGWNAYTSPKLRPICVDASEPRASRRASSPCISQAFDAVTCVHFARSARPSMWSGVLSRPPAFIDENGGRPGVRLRNPLHGDGAGSLNFEVGRA